MTEFLSPVLGLAAVAVVVIVAGHRREIAAAVRSWWEGLPPSDLDVPAAVRRHRGAR